MHFPMSNQLALLGLYLMMSAEDKGGRWLVQSLCWPALDLTQISHTSCRRNLADSLMGTRLVLVLLVALLVTNVAVLYPLASSAASGDWQPSPCVAVPRLPRDASYSAAFREMLECHQGVVTCSKRLAASGRRSCDVSA